MKKNKTERERKRRDCRLLLAWFISLVIDTEYLQMRVRNMHTLVSESSTLTKDRCEETSTSVL
jgi:hypothetical protein